MKALSIGLLTTALALGGCDNSGSENAAGNAAEAQPGEAREAAGGQTIAASLDQNSRFLQASKAVGLDATLAGPGPYTVLVPTDEAFGKVQGGVVNDATNPQNRAEMTRILTYHILPGVVLAEDIGKAVDAGNGKAMLATMGGETLTATKEDGNIVVSDGSGAKATVTQADQQRSNGVVHQIDAVLAPPAAGQASGQQQQQPAG